MLCGRSSKIDTLYHTIRLRSGEQYGSMLACEWERRSHQTRQGRQGVADAEAKNRGANDKLSFAEDTAAKTGMNKCTVRRGICRGELIAPDVLHEVVAGPDGGVGRDSSIGMCQRMPSTNP
jgi:hypothetical protein